MTTDVYTHPDLDEQEARLARRAAAAKAMGRWSDAQVKARRLVVRLTAQLEGHATRRRPE